jgi:CubicO group peptidase (beta-lactamase class C family)
MKSRILAAALGGTLALALATGGRDGGVLTLRAASRQAEPAAPYFPPRGEWRKVEPAAAGFDKARLEEAIAFAIAHENPDTKDLAVAIPNQFRAEAPYNTLIGPTQPRAGANGLIVHRGSVVAEWGDTGRADMTFSITKTFLSTIVGLAFDRGRIRSITDRVAEYMPPEVDLFSSEHNAPITWEHLLRQTSDWSGTLWGKPDWADRPPRGQTPAQWEKRELRAPGTFFEYNDTRVNVLALSALYVLRQPLPDELKASIMDPIGASSTWHWEGYENSWVEIDGRRIKSMTGGGHFGGGMFVSAYDMARFGYLFLHGGKWDGQQLISRRWIDLAKSPGPANASYGFCNWYLNNPLNAAGADGALPFPSAPRSAITFQGNGVNVIYLDYDNDLLMVVRWIDSNRSLDQFVGKVLAARK